MGNKVSICIPAYNNIIFLGKCLQSILDQTYTNYEVVVTDDSDNSNVKELIDQYDFNGKLLYYKNEKALGSPKNWNYCISKANGQYIKILHHDDWFSSKTSLEELVNLLESSENSFAFCGCNNLSTDNEVLFSHSITDTEVSNLKSSSEFLFYCNRIGAPSVMIFKKSSIQFDEKLKYLVDVEFYIQLLKSNNKFSYTTKILVNIGHSDQQVTNAVINNRDLLIFENSYTYNKLLKTAANFRWHFEAFWSLIVYLKINSVDEIKKYRWQGDVPRFVINIIRVNKIIRDVRLQRVSYLIKAVTYKYTRYINRYS